MGTWIVLAVVATIVVLIIRSMVADWKKGESLSCGNCGTCPFKGSCHQGSPVFLAKPIPAKPAPKGPPSEEAALGGSESAPAQDG